MIAIYLAPVYIILNLYILRWAYLWMGSCHSILRTMAFRTIFAIIYTIVSTSLVSGFFIKKPRVLHRALKITGNYFLGILLADDRDGGRSRTVIFQICMQSVVDSLTNCL